jgi:broad specificity phosphatase PhoE
MKVLTAVFILFYVTLSCQDIVKQNTTTYYLIRHAEKERGPDPILTEKGKERAQFWAEYFKGKKLDAIYSTDTKRTIATAEPTAKEFDLMVKTYDADKMYSSSFKEQTAGKTVLIVGHSNTTPEFVNEIIAEKRYPQIDDNEFGTVFKVTLENGKSKVEQETINSWDKP